MPMDTSAPWRAIETPESTQPEPPPQRLRLDSSRLLLVAIGFLVALSIAAALLVAGQQGGQVEVVSGAASSSSADVTASRAPAATQPMLVVEVSGAVVRPGVYSLPVGSRVADAIAAAGGYSADVDPRLAEAQLNLAAKLVDAQLIHVPRRGEAGAASPGTGSVAGAVESAGPIDLNTATAAQLDTLPGVGPVTAQKIISAREQQPFRSVDDLVTRKIVPASTLAKFRAMVTVG
jgi:competence protein ComEA